MWTYSIQHRRLKWLKEIIYIKAIEDHLAHGKQSSENGDGCGGHDGEEAEIRRKRRSWAYHEIESNV